MKKWIINLLLKFVNIEMIVDVVVGLIIKLLDYAKSKGKEGKGDSEDGLSDKKWDIAKNVVDIIGQACQYFVTIYADDNMSEDEEAKIKSDIIALLDKHNLSEKITDKIKDLA